MLPVEFPLPLRSDPSVFDIDDSDDENDNAMDTPKEEVELEEEGVRDQSIRYYILYLISIFYREMRETTTTMIPWRTRRRTNLTPARIPAMATLASGRTFSRRSTRDRLAKGDLRNGINWMTKQPIISIPCSHEKTT